MKKTLLFVNACIRGEKSRTLELSRYYIEKFLENEALKGDAEWEVKEVELDKTEIPLQTKELLNEREELIKKGDFSGPIFTLAKEFMEADHLVFGAPYWDLHFPAVMKIYLERCSVSGLTYIYEADGSITGCCKAKTAAYVMTAGGYTTGMNYGYEYVRGLMKNLFQLEDVKLLMAEGIDIFGNDARAIIDAAKSSLTF